MDEIGNTELSEEELDLLGNFLNQTHDGYMKTVAQVLTEGNFGSEASFGAGIGDVIHFLSDDVSEIDRQVFRLDSMRRSLDRSANASPPERDMPENAIVTPEKLHQLSIRSELTSYYSQVGVLLEEFSTELILEEVVDDSRQSKRVRRDIENKSQWEREWLLFITGIIDSGQKDNLRSVYKKRNNLVHNSKNLETSKNSNELLGEVKQAWDTVDALHDILFGLKLEHRISEIIIGNGFP